MYTTENPLRPVLSIPVSCYHKLKMFLPLFLQKIEGANIETNNNDAKKNSGANKKMNKSFLLDIKSLYTNAPVKEAINIAGRSLHAGDDKPDTSRTTMKRLLELAVTNVHFKCNEDWYCQKDGLAMVASLAVFSANFWMKSWEPHLKLQTAKCNINAQWSTLRNCKHRVTELSRRV